MIFASVGRKTAQVAKILGTFQRQAGELAQPLFFSEGGATIQPLVGC